MYGLGYLVFYRHILRGYHIFRELLLILIKTTFLQVGIWELLYELIEELSNNINIILFVNVAQDIIKIYIHKDIKLFCWYLIDISLKSCWCVGKAKRSYLILKMTVFDTKSRLSLVFFVYFHMMVDTNQIELDKFLSPSPSIQQLANRKKQISILDGQIMKKSIINR